MKKKIFVIITNSYMGDILLLNSLVQNIKSLYKESFVVVLTDKQHQDSARYQQGVDDVVIWDREEKHKSLAGTIKFVLEFPYKNVFATFPLYSSDRMIILSVLLRSKYILFYKKGNFFDIFQKTKYKIIKEDTTVQKANLLLLKGLTKYPLFDMPIKFNPPKSAEFPYTKDYIAICAVTSKPEKDIPIETVEYLIKEFQNKQILFLGCGEKAEALWLELESKNYKVVTSAGASMLKQLHNFIFVLTPERLLYLLIGNPSIRIDYLFIDEAHKISARDGRSAFYYNVVDMLSERTNKPHIIFASPNIPNPEVYLKLIPDAIPNKEQAFHTSFSPVSQFKYFVDLIDRKIELYNEKNDTLIPITSVKENVEPVDIIRAIVDDKKHGQSIVYPSNCSATIHISKARKSQVNKKNSLHIY